MKKTFRQFIGEDEEEFSFDLKFELFIDDCSIYFKNCPNSFFDVLWRGDKAEPNIDTLTPEYRVIPKPTFHTYDSSSIKSSGRTPKDTPKLVHDKANEIFIKLLGYPFRDGVMATGNKNEAGSYNIPSQKASVFIPVNGFEMCYSPLVADFFGEIIYHSHLDSQYTKMDEEEIVDEVKAALTRAGYVKGERYLQDAIKSLHEVMFYPKDGQTLRYYLFSEVFWDDEIVPRLKKHFTNR